ncbi:PTS system ascorbate-specific IIC component (L-Asc family) [Mycoplasmopsis mustelae]|uniref:Ascorbate-specific PTS system EIIC component n=1 Tax=Mycoplasmopsis mustelae TaxID=171289 RepID=A0A4R7UCN7_9BACT|nr:PTS system ascorbate-specific IIC component (L-Asc family) [Mycoplasmopsis mustelae]
MIKKLNKKKKIGLIIGWSIFAVINITIILVTMLVKTAFPSPIIKGDGTITKLITPWTNEAAKDAFLFLFNKVYMDNFFKVPALLLGSLTFVGYLVMGRGLRQSFIGMLKTIIGYLLLAIGSGALISLAKPVFDTISHAGGDSIKVVPLDPYFALSSANTFFESAFGDNNYVSLISFTFIFAYAINIIMVALKRWTNTNSLMITGHVMLQQSAVVTTILYIILFGNLQIFTGSIPIGHQVGLVVMSGIILGIYWATASTATTKGTNAVTQNAGFSIGHQQMLAIAATYKLGRFFGKKEDSAENKKLPSYLKIFEDNIFTQTIIIFALFLVLFIVVLSTAPLPHIVDANNHSVSAAAVNTKLVDGAIINKTWTSFTTGFGQWNKAFGGANFAVNILGGSLQIVAALMAIITGVRMFITELQQSFHGISEKIIPGAVVAVDVAAVYGFSINSVTFGFVSGVIGQFIGVGIVIGLSQIPNQQVISIAIPLFITLFFNSGSLGVYANASGGWKAAILLPGIIGFLEILIVSFATKAVTNETLQIAHDAAKHGSTADLTKFVSPVATGYIGMADWNLFFGLLMWISTSDIIAAWIFVWVAIIGLLFMGQIVDNGSQTKSTFLQKAFKLKPNLVNAN